MSLASGKFLSQVLSAITVYLYIAVGFIGESAGILKLGGDIEDERWSESSTIEYLRASLGGLRELSGRAVMGATISLILNVIFAIIAFLTFGKENVVFVSYFSGGLTILSFLMSVYYIECWRKLNGIHSSCLDAINMKQR